MKLKIMKKKSDYQENNMDVQFKLYRIYTENWSINFGARKNNKNYGQARKRFCKFVTDSD